jgi:hypothetical protein
MNPVPISQKSKESDEDYRSRVLEGIQKIESRVASNPAVDMLIKREIQSAIDSVDSEHDRIAWLERVHNRTQELKARGRDLSKASQAETKQDMEVIYRNTVGWSPNAMNKKQRVLVIIWIIITALIGLKAMDDVSAYGSKFRSDLVGWITATLIIGALFWLFSQKKSSGQN